MGVKSLWSLLNPVGRPVMLETVEGKAMAIDSSIWIYQFQATMRDKEGRGLVNAHVLGFLRRLSKLLFYGIKPVFVFDGGAPTLKKNTINERRKKKSGAAASHTKLAERLLAAQLRREAVNHVNQSKAKGKGKEKASEENTTVVYLDDIDPSAAPRDPASGPVPKPPTPSKAKKAKFREYDPYALPNLDLAGAIDKAANAAMGPDHRFATDEELRNFVDEIHPEDLTNMSSFGLDVTSSDFRSLPTDVQYEIIGDLRLKSRQTSYARLDMMLKAAPTPMDFSRQQIKFLKQRNDLTQQLLMTTDNIGTKTSTEGQIPVRIASERNKQYVLVKNHGKDGGWILGVKKDDGTQSKPIKIDHNSDEEDSDDDMDMEEVAIPQANLQDQHTATAASPEQYHDADLREYRRTMALSSIAGRSKSTRKGLAPISRRPPQKAPKVKPHKSIPLFEPDPDDPLPVPSSHESEEASEGGWLDEEEEDDTQLSYAIQASLDHPNRHTTPSPPPGPSRASGSHTHEIPHSEPSRLETMLAFAGASPRKVSIQTSPGPSQPLPKRVFPPAPPMSAVASTSSTISQAPTQVTVEETAEPGDWEPSNILHEADASANDVEPHEPELQHPSEDEWAPGNSLQPTRLDPEEDDEDMDMEEVPVDQPAGTLTSKQSKDLTTAVVLVPSAAGRMDDTIDDDDIFEPSNTLDLSQPAAQDDDQAVDDLIYKQTKSPITLMQRESPVTTSHAHENTGTPITVLPTTTDRPSPQPPLEIQTLNEDVPSVDTTEPTAPEVEEHSMSWDAAQEMDPQAEETEFASFLSEVANRNINDVQKEIDAEIQMLNQQRKAALRDSEDVTQAMINQIMMMLRLFGIPYITAPMEAEAQCAELVGLGLVEGVITDDSDVFLFGKTPTGPSSFSEEYTPRKVRPLKVYKNMFNQSKTVEVYHLTDLTRELGLDRGALVRLAYLLGSDYTEGLPGVGPVLAMELLAEFPRDDGLFKFREWWLKVQTGRDKEDANTSSFRRRFKKKFKSLYLPDDWPNTAVMDAYYHPTVDSSDEPFKWGLPDLDGLRAFLNTELGWNQGRVDELLLPIIKKMGKRTTATALNRQGTLASYIGGVGSSDGNAFAGGSGGARKKTAYASKRLQKIVTDYRKEQLAAKRKSRSGSTSDDADETGDPAEDADATKEDQPPPAKKPRKRAAKGPTSKKGAASKSAAKKGKKTSSAKQPSSDDDNDNRPTVEFGDSASGSEYEDGPTSGGKKKVKTSQGTQEEGAGSSSAPVQAKPPRPKPRPRRKAAAAPQYAEEDGDAAMEEERAPH